jgi:2-succinyl-5-enolpyruvyl-6-hydroxy-3-cyclohexene-1-carboxylate synthase
VTEADLLVTGPSWSVRHVSCYAGALKGRCVANRGTSGIDGVISTAWGAAIGHADGLPGATTYALVGDLTAIYDRNGLLVPQVEALPRLVYVVADNDGGGIFSSLEQGAEEFAADFERVFGTPLSADMAELLCAPRIDVMTVDSADALRGELRRDHAGVRVIVARCLPRTDEARLVSALTTSVDAAIT